MFDTAPSQDRRSPFGATLLVRLGGVQHEVTLAEGQRGEECRVDGCCEHVHFFEALDFTVRVVAVDLDAFEASVSVNGGPAWTMPLSHDERGGLYFHPYAPPTVPPGVVALCLGSDAQRQLDALVADASRQIARAA